MITINDDKHLLNLSHTVIFLMLTSDEHRKYGEKLKALYRYSTLTMGLFSFDIVEKGETPYEKLPEDMTRAASECNVLVRLINHIHGVYCYGLEKIDLSDDMDSIVRQLKMFVVEVCRRDIDNLDILIPRSSSVSTQAIKYYKAHNLFKEVFENALREYAEDARLALENATNSFDVAISHELMQGAVDNKRSSKNEQLRLEVEAPFTKPDISVSIKHNVNTGKKTKTGNLKKGTGLEISINNERPTTLYFGSTPMTFLYIALLMAKMEDKKIRRRDFTRNVDKEVEKWLHVRYRALAFVKDYDEFIDSANSHGRSAALIDDSKSKANNTLWKILPDKYKDAYHYLCILTKNKRKPDSRYEIRIDGSKIKIDPKIAGRIGECNT